MVGVVPEVASAGTLGNMSSDITPEGAAAAARDLLNDRIAIIEKLAGSSAQLAQAQEALSSAERNYASQWSDAERAGWSVAELRKVGLVEPGRKRPGRPRKAAKPPTTTRPPEAN